MGTEKRILGVLLTDRVKEAEKIQKVLTEFGCSIKTRLGLHEASSTTCARHGLIVLELTGDPKEWDRLEGNLGKIAGVEIRKMSFSV